MHLQMNMGTADGTHAAASLLTVAILLTSSHVPGLANELTTESHITASRVEAHTPDTTDDEATTSELVKHILSDIDTRLRPRFGGPPVEVECGLYVISFGSVSEVSMDYTLNVFLRQAWTDKRMAFTDGPKSIILNAKAINEIWTPDLYFTNEKKAAFHDITVPNRRIKLFQNGSTVYSVRLSLTLSCPMDLSHFPMDKQTCKLGLESYAYDYTEMMLKWANEKPVEMNPELELPQFDLKDVETYAIIKKYTGADFSQLRVVFSLQRQYGFYLLQTFVPSMLIVVLSWVSFWISKDAVPARISLSVTTVLTMTTQLSGSKSDIPRVSYPKAIDVWMSVCMIFVFAALLEYAFVNTLTRKKKKREYRGEDGETSSEKRLSREDIDNWRTRILVILNRMDPANALDKISRVIFPGSFILFNIVYWAVYLPRH